VPCHCALSFIASTRESDFDVFGEAPHLDPRRDRRRLPKCTR
jgi:hypothetical protein